MQQLYPDALASEKPRNSTSTALLKSTFQRLISISCAWFASLEIKRHSFKHYSLNISFQPNFSVHTI